MNTWQGLKQEKQFGLSTNKRHVGRPIFLSCVPLPESRQPPPCSARDLWRSSFFKGPMAKRLTDSEKWNDPWFHKLPPELKLFWIYLVDNCDHAGLWKANPDLAEFQTGVTIVWGEGAGRVPKELEERVVPKGDYWFIPKFLKFQYGESLNKGDAVSGALEKIRNKGFSDSLQTLMGGSIHSVGRVKAKAMAKAKAEAKAKEGGMGETKPETQIQKVVKGWKMLNELPIEGPESAEWDKVHFPRHAKSAKSLLGLFGYEGAINCMEHVFWEMKNKKLSCTIETIVKHSDLYREKLAGSGR